MKTTRLHSSLQGSALVSFGAFLWATDALFRSQLTSKYSAIFIVSVTHLLCLVVALPLFFKQWKKIQKFDLKQWFAILFVSIAGSALAMFFFTLAFAKTSNFNIPILLQKLQPVIAIFLAKTILKETLNQRFLIFASIAICGAYLISFGDLSVLAELKDARLETVIYSLLAVAIWGSSTVCSRYLLKEESYLTITSARYVIAALTLCFFLALSGEASLFKEVSAKDIQTFIMMAYIPGLIALFIYYLGLEKTTASQATICELAFPIGAIFINWYFLNATLTFIQILGALMLILSVTAMSLFSPLHKKQVEL